MSTLERLASDIAERIGTVMYKTSGKDGFGTPQPHYFAEDSSVTVTKVLEAIQRCEARGEIVVVTDDVAVFRFPVCKEGQ